MVRLYGQSRFKIFNQWPIVGINDTHASLLVAYVGKNKLLRTILDKMPELKTTLEATEAWTVKWISIEKRDGVQNCILPAKYFSGYGNYLCIHLPLDSMFYLKLRLLHKIDEITCNLENFLSS